MRELELRNYTGAVELRASDKGLGVLTGYASVFNKLSQNLGGFVERVDPAAFNKSLADGGPVFGRFNHEDNFLLGTTAAGTLRLFVDGTGLRYEIDLPDTTAGRDVRVLAERGDLVHSSFAFRTVSDEWGFTEDDFPLRTLTGVQLVDVAPVVNPAYRDSTTGLRSLADHFKLPLDDVRSAVDRKVNIRTLVDPPKDDKDSGAHGDGAEKEGQGETHPNISALRRKLGLSA